MKTGTAQSKPALREFAVWRASGEHFSERAASVLEIARRYKQVPEPGTEVIAVVEMTYLVRPSTVGLPIQFAALRSPRAS